MSGRLCDVSVASESSAAACQLFDIPGGDSGFGCMREVFLLDFLRNIFLIIWCNSKRQPEVLNLRQLKKTWEKSKRQKRNERKLLHCRPWKTRLEGFESRKMRCEITQIRSGVLPAWRVFLWLIAPGQMNVRRTNMKPTADKHHLLAPTKPWRLHADHLSVVMLGPKVHPVPRNIPKPNISNTQCTGMHFF